MPGRAAARVETIPVCDGISGMRFSLLQKTAFFLNSAGAIEAILLRD
jgi:hypothetical protein